ncbi:lipopolysaccharide assembly protein LapB [Kangiella sp. TOML190]|uniref:tetratricopeptide repeat protein n=1 Tax=Kangiella sp. TOML190 TaxID=2931351 RepID=UPI00203D0079|nr:tetratricopeptide repeat protein [Kangiella sp. TOML190]
MDSTFISYFGILFAIVVAVYNFSKFSISHMSQSKRESFSLWLWGDYEDSWIKHYNNFFDSIFGSKHLSVRCIVNSCIASLSFVLILYVVFNNASFFSSERPRIQTELALFQILTLGILINFVPDYLSLLQTRYLLKLFENVKGVFGHLFLLFADIVLSAVIISTYILVYLWIANVHDVSIMKMVAAFSVYSIFFYSTFLTSFLSWLYVLSTWVMKLSSKTFLSRWLDIESKPGSSLGIILSGLVLSIGIAMYPFIKQDNKSINIIEKAACYISPDTCGDVAFQSSDKSEVMQYLTRACLKSENSTHDCFITGIFHKQLGNIKMSDKMFDKACNDESPIDCFVHGIHFYDLNEFMLAEKAFLKFLDIGHAPHLAYSYLGYIYAAQNRHNDALSYFKKHLERFPKSEMGYAGLSYAYLKSNDLDKAEQYAKKAIQLSPESHYSLYALGNVLAGRTKHNEAIKIYKKSISLHPESLSSYIGLALSLHSANRIKEADEAYRKVISINENIAQIQFNYAILLLNSNRSNEAMHHFDETLRIKSNDEDLYLSLANQFQKLKEYEKVVDVYKHLTELLPDDAKQFSNYGVSLKRIGEYAKAEEAYRKAIALNPNYKIAYMNLKNLLITLKRFSEAEKVPIN